MLQQTVRPERHIVKVCPTWYLKDSNPFLGACYATEIEHRANTIFVESLKWTPMEPSDRTYPTPYLTCRISTALALFATLILRVAEESH